MNVNQMQTDQKQSVPDTVMVCFLTTIDHRPKAAEGAIAFYDEFQPGHGEKLEKMLPTRLSATGAEPATHALCFMRTADRHMAEAQISYIQSHSLPMAGEILGPSHRGGDWIQRVHAARDRWLATRDLKVIEEQK